MAFDYPRESEPEHIRTLFVGGILSATSATSLTNHFAQWGRVEQAVIKKNMITGNPRNFGFVVYSHAHMVDDAQNARPHVVDGRTVDTRRAVPREESARPETRVCSTKLYVDGLKWYMEEEHLIEYFKNYGNVVSCEIFTSKKTGIRTGSGFVEFDDYDPVDKIYVLRPHYVNGELIEVKKSMSRALMAAAASQGRGAGRGAGRGESRGMAAGSTGTVGAVGRTGEWGGSQGGVEWNSGGGYGRGGWEGGEPRESHGGAGGRWRPGVEEVYNSGNEDWRSDNLTGQYLQHGGYFFVMGNYIEPVVTLVPFLGGDGGQYSTSYVGGSYGCGTWIYPEFNPATGYIYYHVA